MAGGASSAAAAQRVGAALSADADFKVVAVALAGLMNILRTGELEAQAAARVEQVGSYLPLHFKRILLTI